MLQFLWIKMIRFVCPKCGATFRSPADLLWKPIVASIRRKLETVRLGDFGEELFSTLITLKLGWTPIQAAGLDKGGIDREFRLGNAIIDTQIKTRSMAPDGSWFFDLRRADGSLHVGFYDENPRAYLVLIGIHSSRAELLKSQDPLQTQKTILMISGKKVVEYFKANEIKSYTISITYRKFRNNEYPWLKGANNLGKIFADEYRKQTGKEMPTENLET